MEPWVVGTIVSAYTTVFGGVVVALINRSGKKVNGKGGAYNGEERRVIDAALDKHTLNCPNVAKLETAMKEGFEHLGALLETHRNQAHPS